MTGNKNSLKISLIPVIFIFLISCKGYCQRSIYYPDFLYEGYGGSRVMYLVFYDSLTRDRDTLWFPSINPFNYLNYKKTGINEQGYVQYQLSGSEVQQLIPPSYRAIYDIDRRNILSNEKYYYARSNHTLFYNSNNLTAIGFSLLIFNTSIECIGTLGAIKIYDKYGNLKCEMNNLDVNINRIGVPDDGHYFAINYGYCDEDGWLLHQGFRIYNSASKKLIKNEISNYNLGGPIIRNSLILLTDDSNVFSIYYVYDTKNSILFTKEFSFDDVCRLKKITDEGFIFQSQDGSTNTVYFESFNKEIVR